MATVKGVIIRGGARAAATAGVSRISQRATGTPEVLAATFGQRFDPMVLAISGDQTQHVLYRLRNGEAPAKGAIFVLLIGTNNLGNGHLPGEAADGVLAVVEELAALGKVVVLAILPRGDVRRLGARH